MKTLCYLRHTADETPSSITLVEPEGQRTVILRSDVEELRAEPRSLMPVGFEEKLSLQEMADLLATLKAPPAP